MEDINFKCICNSIVKKMKYIVLVLLISLIVSFIYLYVTLDRKYIATLNVVMPKSNLTEEYSKLILDENIINDISSEYGIDKENVKSSVTIDNSKKKLFLIGISVKNEEADVAKSIVTRIANRFIENLNSNYGIENVSITSANPEVLNTFNNLSVRECIKKSIIFSFISTLSYVILAIFIEIFFGIMVDKKTIEDILKKKVIFEISDFNLKSIKSKKMYKEEQFRKLKSRIDFKYLRENKNAILFTSTTSKSGITYVVENLYESLKESLKVKVVKFDEKCNIEKILDEGKKNGELLLIDSKFLLASSNIEGILGNIDNLILVEEYYKINVRKLEEAREVLEFYNIKNASVVINKKNEIDEIIRYREFRKESKTKK